VPRLILFDIDGTLLLTGGAGVAAMTRAFADAFGIADAFAGIPMPGRTDRGILADAMARQTMAVDGEPLERFRSRYVACLTEEIAVDRPRKRVLPGVRALLDALSEDGDVLLGLVTGNFAEAARIKLEHFGLWHYFACGAYGDEAVERPPLVSLAFERARRHRPAALTLDQTFVVGDTPHDVQAALTGGARAVGVATGPFGVEALAEAGAELVFPDFADTDRVVRSMRSLGSGRGA
jgi:phosphoglycolate phosphatase-like HAD superfamily hydrolase